MLPSERLRLNASKSESLPVRGDAAGVPPEGGPRQRLAATFPWGAGPIPPTPLTVAQAGGRELRAVSTPPFREGRQITCRRLGYGSGCRAQ